MTPLIHLDNISIRHDEHVVLDDVNDRGPMKESSSTSLARREAGSPACCARCMATLA